MSKHSIECADFKDHDDSGRWRSYDLETFGDTLDELLDNAIYWQTDQDGGSLGECAADDDAAVEYITKEFHKREGALVHRMAPVEITEPDGAA